MVILTHIAAAKLSWAEPVRAELKVAIGHTSRETLIFTIDGEKRAVGLKAGVAVHTSAIERKAYQSWLTQFRELRARGIALKDHQPSCGHIVTFWENSRPGVDVCYDRDLRLDSKIAKLWREVRTKVIAR